MAVWREVRAIDWTKLGGAYGTDRDVPGALEAMRFGADASDEAFAEAWNDVLLGHVWHQGTIYPVTPKVIPFIFDIVERSPALKEDVEMQAQVAEFVLHCAESARDATDSSDAEARAVGKEVLEVLASLEPRLRAWAAGDHPAIAIATLVSLPALSEPLLAGEVAEPERVLGAVLIHASRVDRGALTWAAGELERAGDEVSTRAASILRAAAAGTGVLDPTDSSRLFALGHHLSGGYPELEDVAMRFGIKKQLDRPGTTEAEVTVSTRDWFVAELPGQRKLTVRWQAHPFVEGDRVTLLDINERNIPREVHGIGAKAARKATFDEKGKLQQVR